MLERPAPAGGIVVEDLDDELCLYRPDTAEVLVLNQTAGDVWRLCDGSADVAEIVRLLASAYRSTPDALAEDVRAVLVDLHERGYLVDAG
ncbi:MAG TPA: PqqD family protein [Jatrophihabitantaceae bacterium]